MTGVGTWVRLPDGTADFVWETVEGRVLVSRSSRRFRVEELRRLTAEEIARAQTDSNARFPQTLPTTNVQPDQEQQELLAQRIQLARDLVVAGRTVEVAFELADAFADEVLRRQPRKERP